MPQQQDKWDALRDAILDEIRNFGAESNGYGQILYNHLLRTANNALGFLQHLGYGEAVCQRIFEAMLIHDWGKVDTDYYTPEDWMTKDRPDETLRQRRRMHTGIGERRFSSLIKEHDDLRTHPYFEYILPAVMRDHHNLDDNSRLIRTLATVDTYDGDTHHHWPHQDEQRDMPTEFRRLLGLVADNNGTVKYAGKTDTELVLDYAAYKGGEALRDQLGHELHGTTLHKQKLRQPAFSGQRW